MSNRWQDGPQAELDRDIQTHMSQKQRQEIMRWSRGDRDMESGDEERERHTG